jgi:hypothetical protein
MSEIKVNSIKGVGASAAAITVNNTDGTCTANITNNLSNRNKVINGEFLVNQRGNSTNGSNSGYFGPDRFKWRDINSSSVFTINQSTDTPDGFAFSYHADCTTADASFGGNEFISIQHKLEGQNLQDFAKGTSSAKQYTLSFHVKSDVTGTYVVAFQDTDNNRMCCATYTVSSADTWEKKTITIPADTTGAFNNDANESLMISWCLGSGTDYTSGTLQTVWGADVSANTFAGQTANVGSSTDNDFRLTGVQLEVGSVATDFEHRSFAQELQLCKRYFQKVGGSHWGATEGSDHFRIQVNLEPEMRAAPTVTVRSGGKFNTRYSGDTTITNPTLASTASKSRNVWTGITSSGLTGGIPIYGRSQQGDTGDFMACSAEL